MGRHSRKGSAPSVADTGQQAAAPQAPTPAGAPGTQTGRPPQGGTGRRRRTAGGGGQDPAGTPMYGTPAHGTPMYGTPAHGTPGYGTPAHGTPMYGTPAHGGPGYGGGAYDTGAHAALGTPAHGVPVYGSSVRGGHPQHEEGSASRPYAPRHGAPRTEETGQAASQAPFIPGPRRETLPEADEPTGRGGLGRTLTGVAAAAVATVLAVVVTGQVADKGEAPGAAHAAGQPDERASDDTSASRSDERTTPSSPAAPAPTAPPPPTYEQLIARQYPIDPKLKGSGAFKAVPGFQKAPGKGNLVRYRIDVEEGLGLDQNLFATAVFTTLNDRRSWAGNGEMTFERISSGEPQFVITLASPGTTGVWCEKSGLDTLAENVSCDSAQTDRVMINAYRWAQGSETFGPKAMFAYRQMLINHEVGHRLGHGHVNCGTPGALAPVMQQQTKSLNIDGIKCRPNPWVHPGS
ncbi:DUF3152 domain-containing protein [Streptomyces sp. NBC_00233]|uniref:DUF3152 domain-containing protein n=1 Tax=Streptomyces sp. NBC_00233 TaxID=2975686 RepID=UPI00225A9A96|nr:DUF3152 domain-containing protein [Streptomyces sp. NBC_00233]MCX5228504.1 DUF3152 domain-containing protein [Streptomyces sp. NBC_00233]